jgi:hypothetical protein
MLSPSDSIALKNAAVEAAFFCPRFSPRMTIHSRATGYIQSTRATMPVLIPRLLIANLKRMPSSS